MAVVPTIDPSITAFFENVEIGKLKKQISDLLKDREATQTALEHAQNANWRHARERARDYRLTCDAAGGCICELRINPLAVIGAPRDNIDTIPNIILSAAEVLGWRIHRSIDRHFCPDHRDESPTPSSQTP